MPDTKLERAVIGALQAHVHAHGPSLSDSDLGSAAKRVIGEVSAILRAEEKIQATALNELRMERDGFRWNATLATRQENERLQVRVGALDATVTELQQSCDAAYTERNQLVAALSRLFPSHFALHPAEDTTWDPAWRTIICIHSPAGQLTWHIHDRERALFDHLYSGENHWDGHTTDEKYRRVAKLWPF